MKVKSRRARELEGLAAVAQVTSFDGDRIKADLRARVADVKGLLARRKPSVPMMVRHQPPPKLL